MKNEKNYVDVVVLVRNVWIKIRKITGHPMALKKENINNLEVNEVYILDIFCLGLCSNLVVTLL